MIFLCRSVNMKELLYLGVKLAASCVEAGYEKVKEDWSEKFNIDNDNDLSFLRQLPFEELKRLYNILVSEDNIFLNKIKGIVQKNINEFDESNVDELVKFIISEIHLLGGNTLVNLGRGNQGVTYKEIVKDVCERIGINKKELKSKDDIKTLENLFFKEFRQQFDKLKAKYDLKNKSVTDDEIKEKLFDEYTNGLLKTLLPNNLTGPAWRKTIRIVLIITELRKNIVV